MDAKSISALFVLTAFVIVLPGIGGHCADTPTAPKPSRPLPGALPDGPGLGPGGGRFGPGYQRLLSVLTEEQRASLREAMNEQSEKARQLEERFRAATRELYAAGLANKFDENVVREKALAAAKAEAELSVLRFKAFSKMRPPLSAEQIGKLRDQAPERTGPPRLNENEDGTGPIQGELPHKVPARQHDDKGLPVINPGSK